MRLSRVIAQLADSSAKRYPVLTIMANPQHLDLLRQGVTAWNAWRKANPGLAPDLRRADLFKARLSGADLSHADLRKANLSLADLSRASLAFADLKGARLSFANLAQADLRAARLKEVLADDARFNRANLDSANLRDAQLSNTCFKGASLTGADLTGGNMAGADLSQAGVLGVRHDRAIFWTMLRQTGPHPRDLLERSKDLILGTTMRVKGINAATCHGSQIFKLFLQDQDFLEEYYDAKNTRSLIILWWMLSDCGRSLARWAGWSGIFALLFALAYFLMGPAHFHTSYLPFSFTTMVYYSGVTFSTLGFGDITPMTSTASLMVLAEVVVGYVMLGGLVSIFAGKLGRRGG